MSETPENTVYVITGANRGIGLGLAKAYLGRPRTTVIATVRNQQAADVLKSEISTVELGENSVLDIIELDFTRAESPEKIRSAFNIARIDVLINNAGAAGELNRAVETTAEDLRACFEINTIAPLMMFQALWPLMQKAESPKLIMVTSTVGFITYQEFPGGAYGPSKAALNWLTRALHLQEDKLTAVALHPGWVQTAMGYSAAQDWKFAPGPPETIEGCVKGMIGIIDNATRDKYSGKFVTYKGEEYPW
ncbi:hypothetical protein B0I35DRAFT_363965 [Stachybotrys elegans]|uniref:Uncharacterized protein n=1 Tax=Stachybotrys elegans TaxID=80388 RepID=A0A8K0SBR9_9HYPO|nr:hypothetical protein B0I35DRAFT_363965 [Stachybotrys elegans]